MKSLQESQFVDHIVSKLTQGGYKERKPKDLDLTKAIDVEIFINFVKQTQPEAWEKLQEHHGPEVQVVILDNLIQNMDSRGMLDVLRNGFRVSDVLIDCVYFKPISTLNKQAQEHYQQNILSVIREARIDKDKPGELDLLLCVNGLPIVTSEVKNLETELSFKDAEKQYRETRDPEARLLEFKKRTLVHFAVDQLEVSMTTKLEWNKTHFRPFNQGRNDGAGNPDNKPYRTSYLWEKIWQKDILLDILKNFIHLESEDPVDALIPTKEYIVFPRYHQIDCVLELESATKKNGPGTNYLIMHSPGSGKSNSIAWLAYKLFSLHDGKNEKIYDSVLVLSDRVGIVGQLQDTVSQFEQTRGLVEGVKTSTNLADILKKEKKILITTQQKFHNLISGNKLDTLKGTNFAIIVDEAHSSQGGKSQTKVKEVLSLNDDAEKTEPESEEEDFVDLLKRDMDTHGPKKNLSFFAFTATPKDKTLSLFGTPGKDGKNHPFHVYSMNQAIEEGYILDVLQNVITYKRYFEIQKTSPEDKAVEAAKAQKTIMQFIDEHQANIEAKSKVIVDHFLAHSKDKILGKAKAMVVAGRRSQAYKYKQKIDEYLKKIGHDEIQTLVAFSGDLFDEQTKEKVNEHKINHIQTDEELREQFEKPEYKFLIVADKYQTGFNQPLLHSMYVDKKISGIRAVQSLSRLNRTIDEKNDVFVLLFKNDEEEIKSAFEPFYTRTELLDKVGPGYLNELFNKIMSFNIIMKQDIDSFNKFWYKNPSTLDKDEEEKNRIISPIKSTYEKLAEKDQDEFRLNLRRYTKNYSFLTQITKYDDLNLEGLYLLAVHLVKFLKGNNSFDYQPEPGDLTLRQYRLVETGHHHISLDKKPGEIIVEKPGAKPKEPEELAYLSEIIKIINERHGFLHTVTDVITSEDWLEVLKNMQELRDFALNNEFDYFIDYFEEQFQKIVSRSYGENPTLVSRFFADEKLRIEITKKGAALYYKWVQENNLPPITKSTPALNRLNFRQTIAKCQKYIHWVDRYFGTGTLEFLMAGIDKQNVKEIKLLASLFQSGMNKELHKSFVNFVGEMKSNGIDCQLRVITNKDLHYEIHDRIIECENSVHNVPSASQVNMGQYSEIKKTPNRPPFLDWWNHGENLDIISDWDKIEQKISTQRTKKYPVTCSVCGIQTEVPFVPDGIRPVYCHDCYSKNK